MTRPGGGSNYSETYVLRLEATALAIEKAVECSYCGALKGTRCVTSSGNLAWVPHHARHLTWRGTAIEQLTEHELLLKVMDVFTNPGRYNNNPAAMLNDIKRAVECELIQPPRDASRDGHQDNGGQGRID
jgi:hypothetical protein